MFIFDTKIATLRPYLLLGAAKHENDYAMLKEAGVTHILQVGTELRPSFPGRFEYLRVAIDDTEQEDIIRQLRRCFKFIDDARNQGGAFHVSDDCKDSKFEGSCGSAVESTEVGAAARRPGVVFVHCMAGMSRSVSVVVAYLMWDGRLPYAEAFKQVKAARPCVYPNLGFLLQLWDWEESGCDLDSWPGWNRARLAERLAEYRRAQDAAGLHRALRVRLPMSPSTAVKSPAAAAAATAIATATAATAVVTTGSQLPGCVVATMNGNSGDGDRAGRGCGLKNTDEAARSSDCRSDGCCSNSSADSHGIRVDADSSSSHENKAATGTRSRRNGVSTYAASVYSARDAGSEEECCQRTAGDGKGEPEATANGRRSLPGLSVDDDPLAPMPLAVGGETVPRVMQPSAPPPLSCDATDAEVAPVPSNGAVTSEITGEGADSIAITAAPITYTDRTDSMRNEEQKVERALGAVPALPQAPALAATSYLAVRVGSC